ncbi:Exc2 family lipoprotein [Providencia manganoxydans]|uniref:Exc2 family lipoprotein n=1 Tax=Providencia manganoxydans TaxID=2923283 RepID=UPI0034E5CC41
MFNFNRLSLVTVVFVLSACHSNMLPYEEISKRYVYQSANEDSDPNFQTNKHESIKLITPFFKQFYDLGIEDKKNKISKEDYEKKLNYLSSNEFINSIESREQFISEKVHVETKKVENESTRQKKIMIDAILAAYKAGYNE